MEFSFFVFSSYGIMLTFTGFSPPRWRRGSGLDCGSEDPGSIPGIPSPGVGPPMARRLKTCRDRLGTLKTPICPWRWVPGSRQNLETRQLSRHYIAEILLNVALNHNQPTNQPSNKQGFNLKNDMGIWNL